MSGNVHSAKSAVFHLKQTGHQMWLLPVSGCVMIYKNFPGSLKHWGFMLEYLIYHSQPFAVIALKAHLY